MMTDKIELVKKNKWLQLTVVYLRYLLGLSFILPAIYMGKLGNKDSIGLVIAFSTASNVEQFFHVISNSGLYWHFIGWFQIIAGVLLVTQRFAKLGALIFFGMMLNIFMIVISFHFIGTPVITGLMTFASFCLLLWDYQEFGFLLRIKIYHRNNYPSIETSNYWTWLGFLLISEAIMAVLAGHIMMGLALPLITGSIGLLLYILKHDDMKPVSADSEKFVNLMNQKEILKPPV